MLDLSREQILLAIVVLALLLLVVFLLWPKPDRFEPKPVLTPNEIEFFRRLQSALPDYLIFTQVALRAIIKPGSPSNSKRYARESGRLGAKHCDFLICDPETLAVVTIIELDDRTHDAEQDAYRDEMTLAAGYPTLRFESKKKPSVAAIRQAVLAL